MRTKTTLLVSMMSMLLLCASTAYAQVPVDIEDGCTAITWSENTETDLKGYNIYIEKNGVIGIPNEVLAPAGSILCSELPFVEGSTYNINMTAFDQSGNESAPSAHVAFNWPDTTPPNVPKDGCISYKKDNIEVETCWTITTP